MNPQNQLDTVLDTIVSIDWVKDKELLSQIIADYERLNKKCDQVILKIRERKSKHK